MIFFSKPSHALPRLTRILIAACHNRPSDQYSSGSDGMASAGSYDALSTPPDSDVMTPLSSAESAPIRTAQLQEWHALSQAQGSAFNPYFPPLPPPERTFAKAIDVDYHGHGVI